MSRFLSRALPVAALACLALAPAAYAQEVVNIFQNGAEVDAQATGTLNLSGLFLLGSSTNTDNISGNMGGVLIGNSSVGFDVYSSITGPAQFGNGSQVFASSGSGDRFAIVGSSGLLAVSTGYVSNSLLNGSAVFANQTLNSLGLTPGTYTYTLPNDTVTVLIGVAPQATPEPGSLALLAGMGLSGVGFLARRRKNARKAV